MDHSTSASPGELLPAELAGHTVESLHAMHGPEGGAVYWLILAGTAGALAALPLIRLDVTVRAPGVVKAAAERVELRTTVSGPISEVLVRDNETVVAGQKLLILGAGQIDEQMRRQRELLQEKSELIADLRALLTEQRPPASLATETLRRQARQLQAQLETYRLAEAKAGSELARSTLLAERGIAPRQELDNARYEVERLRAESRLVRAQAEANWTSLLRDEETARADAASAIRRLEEERVHYEVRAPLGGALVGFTGWAEAGRVLAGQSLGYVSPAGALCVESQVSTRDIGLVRVGQGVKMQIDAFPYTEWGALEGRVESIGADLTAGPANAPAFFKVMIRPAALHLSLPSGLRAELRKGLTLTVRFVVGRRSLLQILYDDASAWLGPQAALQATPTSRP